MTTRHAARRSGFEATGPPSCRISSTTVTFFLGLTSGMDQSLLCHRRRNASCAAQAERSGMYQCPIDERFGKKRTSCERSLDFLLAEVAHTLRHQSRSQITIRSKLVCWNSDYVRMSWEIDRIRNQ